MPSHSLASVIEKLEALAPLSCAETWDNCGLLVGDPAASLQGAVVSVDLTESAFQAAKEKALGLIVTHHPVIFPSHKGISRITAEKSAAHLPHLIYRCIREGVAVYSCHTNFDKCALEVPQKLEKALGLKVQGRFFESPSDPGAQERGMKRGFGYGFWGDFSINKTFKDLMGDVTDLFALSAYRITGEERSNIKRFGFVAGAGGSFIRAAVAQKVELFVTGEASYHDALYGARNGTTVVELGHRDSEHEFAPVMGQWLRDMGLKVLEANQPTQKIRHQEFTK